MDLGLAHFLTDYGMQPAELGAHGRGARLRVALPARAHAHPGEPQDALSRRQRAAAASTATRSTLRRSGRGAAATRALKVGTGVCLVIQRDPIVTAKEVATVDHISGGRFLFGVGAGWNIEEMENHGTDPDTRFRRMRESVEAMKAIWTQDEAEYHGRIVDFDPIWCWPKPVQKPHPPILVGGLGEKVLDRVVAYGDEWIPNRVKSPEDLSERIAELQRRAEAAGPRATFPSRCSARSPRRGCSSA